MGAGLGGPVQQQQQQVGQGVLPPARQELYGGGVPQGGARSNAQQGCWFFGQGQCTKGDSCKFSHDPSAVAVAQMQDWSATVPKCWYIQNGGCIRGTYCHFAHG